MRAEIVAILILVAVAAAYAGSFTGLFIGPSSTYATRIIDGDTIEIPGDERVRLLGIDTPEKGQHLYHEAKQRLMGLIGGKEIFLEPDETDRDKYDRLLRNVFVNRTDLVNAVLVREGLATVYIIPPDGRYEEELREAERLAREEGLGIWRYQHIDGAYCISIYYMRYNSVGDDRENLNDEYVEFRNKCEEPVRLDGWSLRDKSGLMYEFPDMAVQAKETFKLHSGEGTDTSTDIYWNSKRPIWNNAGDELVAFNAQGEVVLRYEYEGYY